MMRRWRRPRNECAEINTSRCQLMRPLPLWERACTAGRHELTPVRGLSPHMRMRREPLTRLRFAKPPSPTRGEGKRLATLTASEQHEHPAPDPASGQRPRGRHALWRGRDVVRADLQGDAGRELRAGRTAAGRRLGVLVAAHQVSGAVLSGHADHAGLHVPVRHRHPDRHPAPDDRRADHFRDHGDDRAVDGILRADEVDVRRQSAAVPAHLPDPERQHPRAAGADRLSDESCGLGSDDDRNGVVLPPLQIWSGDARHRLQPAGGAVARHLREKRVRDGLGDFGHRLRRRRRRGGRRQRRLGRAFRLRRQGVSGGDPRRPRQRRRRGAGRHHHRAVWKTSRTFSTANICTGAISTRSRRSMRSSSS